MTTPTTTTQIQKGFLSLPFLRDLLLTGLVVVITWKVLNADFKIDLASFSFNDFLSMVLALFSMALSVAFYFKANEASNQFYDNTYKFTSEMSEILGRIEAGFGERLRHLDEGYSGMRERLDKLPYGATLSEVKEEEEEIKRKETEQRQLIEGLAQKAQLAAHEKEALFANLAQKEGELEQARGELRQMQASLHPSTSARTTVTSHVVRKLKRALPAAERNKPLTSQRMRSLFNEVKAEIVDAAIEDMRRLDLLDAEDNLTRDALLLFHFEWKRN